MSEKNSNMQVMFVGKEDVGVIKDFLMPEIYLQVQNGTPVTVLALVADNMAVGALGGVVTGKAFRIYSIFVSPSYRRQGGGKLLLESVKKVVSEKNLIVEVSFASVSREEEELERFLEKMGFKEKKGDKKGYYSLSLKDMLKSSHVSGGDEEIGLPFSRIGNAALLRATNESLKKFHPLPENGLLSERINKNTSVGLIRKGEVYAYITIEDIDKDNIFCSAWFPGRETPVIMLKLLRQEIKLLEKNYDGKTRMVIELSDDDMYRLWTHMFKETESISKLYAEKDSEKKR